MEFAVKNFGPIKEANITFGDLTFLVGPQASGKSLLLELFKLVVDQKHIVSTLRNYNFVLSKTKAKNILDWYFGEGLSSLFKTRTSVRLDGESFSSTGLLNVLRGLDANERQTESVFYVPAQRILSMADGRPKNFTEFDVDTPYVLRRFSETLRVFLQGGLGNPDTIFPMNNRLKDDVRNSFNSSIFHDGKIVIDKSSSQRKMKMDVDGANIPFMAWSAGQKEFMPLLLAIYCLSGPTTQVVNREDYKWVIVEEPEMGLHPRAILSVLLEVIELMQSGYRIIVSTHSTTFLEFVWAFNNLKTLSPMKFKKSMCELFEVSNDSPAASLFGKVRGSNISTYYANNANAQGKACYVDVSSLDAFDDNAFVSEWGGLTTFAGRASEIVSKYVAL
jgi:energy-coupling factor transporter ATP-binding protein EcfA2